MLDDIFCGSVANPDPYVFGPPGSRSISMMYGSGSGSFYQQAKIVKKNFDSYCFMIFYIPLPYFTYLISNFQIFRIFLVSGTYSDFPSALCPTLPEKSAKIEKLATIFSQRCGSGSVPICHRSATLFCRFKNSPVAWTFFMEIKD